MLSHSSVSEIDSAETSPFGFRVAGPSGSRSGPPNGPNHSRPSFFERWRQTRSSSEDSEPPSQRRRGRGAGGIRLYKVVVLGDGGVGKSALTLQFVSHCFSEHHDPTIEDAYQQQVVIDGEAALLDILDTAGQVEFNAMRDQYMRCGEGFLICYSVTDRHSFQEALEFKRLINKVRTHEDIPIVLVGNKFDLHSQRRVAMEEGRALAQQFGCPFFETSAALRYYVDDAFYTLVREIRERRRGRRPTKSGGLYSWKKFRSALSTLFRKNYDFSP